MLVNMPPLVEVPDAISLLPVPVDPDTETKELYKRDVMRRIMILHGVTDPVQQTPVNVTLENEIRILNHGIIPFEQCFSNETSLDSHPHHQSTEQECCVYPHGFKVMTIVRHPAGYRRNYPTTTVPDDEFDENEADFICTMEVLYTESRLPSYRTVLYDYSGNVLSASDRTPDNATGNRQGVFTPTGSLIDVFTAKIGDPNAWSTKLKGNQSLGLRYTNVQEQIRNFFRLNPELVDDSVPVRELYDEWITGANPIAE